MRRRRGGDHTTLGRCIALAFTVAMGAAVSVVGARRLYRNARAADPFDSMLDYENSYDLDYDDGDAESRVPARYVRPLATAAPTPLTTTSRAPPADLGEL